MQATPVVRAVDVGYGWTKWVQSVDGGHVTAAAFPSIAPPAGDRTLGGALGHQRDTIEVEVGTLRFEVGHDARLAQGSYAGRNCDDSYCESPEYMALIKGAWSMMKQATIDLLVVGLPVTTFIDKREGLRQRLLGAHQLPGGKTVTVKDVLVLAQPHGALATYGAETGRLGQLSRQRNLIIDCGSRTFDWLVTEGFKTMDRKSHAVNRGMIDVLELIGEGVSKDVGQRYGDLDRIDRSIRTGAKFIVLGKKIDLKPHLEIAQRIAIDAIQAMRRRIDTQNDSATFIDNIVVSGGGAFFFKQQIERAFPLHPVRMMADSMYANVRGFQLLGMDLAMSMARATAPANGVEA